MSDSQEIPKKKIKITDYFESAKIQTSTTVSNQNDQQMKNLNITEQKFPKLTDVLKAGNLRNLSPENDIYIFYKYPYVDNETPVNICSEDDFANSINYIKLPFQEYIQIIDNEGVKHTKWKLIKKLLSCKINNLYELEKSIKIYNPSLKNIEFDILRSYINYELSEDEQEFFFEKLLPSIINLALELPSLICYNLPILEQETNTTLFLSQYQISSLLANAFLCTYTSTGNHDRRCINFSNLFSTNQCDNKKKSCKLEKLKCIINYIRRCTQHKPVGTVSFERKYISELPVLEKSKNKISNLHFDSNGCLFANGCNYSVVDFANKFIGGGVLNTGCVQEEILFVICPELIVSKLFTEKLLDTESILITGIEQFNLHTGYADNFKWKSSYQDTLVRDVYGRCMRQIIVMDALYFSFRNEKTQYEKCQIDREIFKAICAFQCERFLINQSILPTVATGNWGCGVYRGDPYLKTLIQIIAASECKRDLIYFTYNCNNLKMDFDQITNLFENLKNSLTVSQLYRTLLDYAAVKRNSSVDLVEFLREKLLFCEHPDQKDDHLNSIQICS